MKRPTDEQMTKLNEDLIEALVIDKDAKVNRILRDNVLWAKELCEKENKFGLRPLHAACVRGYVNTVQVRK